MSIESVAPYSPTTVYGQLTSPFIVPRVKINAHTPYDKDSGKKSEVFSRANFEENTQITNKGLKNYSHSVQDIYDESSGELSSSILKDSLDSGKSVNESISIRQAYNAYRRVASPNKNAIRMLGSCSYTVNGF